MVKRCRSRWRPRKERDEVDLRDYGELRDKVNRERHGHSDRERDTRSHVPITLTQLIHLDLTPASTSVCRVL
jgi:hypothetical protein